MRQSPSETFVESEKSLLHRTNLDAKKAVIEELSTKDLGDSLSKTALRLREVSSVGPDSLHEGFC